MKPEKIATIVKALGDKNRLQIICLLAKEEMNVQKILEKFSIKQSTLSHHIKILLNCELLKIRRHGKCNYYSLNPFAIFEFKDFFEKLFQQKHEKRKPHFAPKNF